MVLAAKFYSVCLFRLYTPEHLDGFASTHFNITTILQVSHLPVSLRPHAVMFSKLLHQSTKKIAKKNLDYAKNAKNATSRGAVPNPFVCKSPNAMLYKHQTTTTTTSRPTQPSPPQTLLQK